MAVSRRQQYCWLLMVGFWVGFPILWSHAQTEQQQSAQIYTNTLKWVTASEVDNLGFDVYRAEHRDGPFERISESTIAGAGTTDETQYYEYIDDTIDPHQRYYYYIESIGMDGVREMFTPTYEAPPKLSKKAESE